jgi:hypothetical protein
MSDTRFYDPNTAHYFNDSSQSWAGWDTSYKEVNVEGGYFGRKIYTAYIGSPEEQGFVDVYTSNHPDALKWCKGVFEARQAGLKKELAAVEEKLGGYE